jgi:hypothetical protein
MDDDTLRWVDEAYEAGRSEWRELRLERECWKEFLLARKEAASAASHRILADLFLACACQHDVPGALQRFFETYGATIQAAVRPIDATPSFVAFHNMKAGVRWAGGFAVPRDESPYAFTNSSG